MQGVTQRIFLVLIAVSVAVTGCSKKDGSDAPVDDKSGPSYNVKLWKKYDTPPGADPAVSAADGGKGFEEIADSLGFMTNSPSEEDLKYSGDPKAKVGGQIRFSISRFPLSFRPFFYGQNASFSENQMMSQLCYETLTGLNSKLETAPGLATHWKISEDGQTFTFRIDPNARFSNGLPVTSEDVIATFKLLVDETHLSPSTILSFGKYEVPVAKSKYIVEVRCKEKNWRNFLTFGGNINILSAKEIGSLTGKEFIEKYMYEMPSGSGEYIILPQDIRKQQGYTFTRRDDYWAKDYPLTKYTGNFDRVEFTVIKDNPILEYEQFKKGQIDKFRFSMATNDKWLDDNFDALKNNWVKKVRVVNDAPSGAMGYYFNMRIPPFSDPRVRMAFTLLLDRESICNKLLRGEYVPTDSWYDNLVYANPNNPKYRYDAEKAAALLAEAGYTTRNSAGILMRNGKPLRVEIGIAKPLERFVTPYQQTLQQAGIDFQIKLVDPNTMTKNVNERNFEIAFLSYGGLLFPNPETSLLSSLADKKDNNNVTGFKNPVVDKICEDYKVAFDQAKRVEMIRIVDSIQVATNYAALTWRPKGIRIAFWQKFGMPEYVLGRYTDLGDEETAMIGTWWYDREKVKQLEDAKKQGKALAGSGGIVEADYWKKIAR